MTDPRGGQASVAELEGRTVLLGVTGSIAAFKAVEVLRLLTRAGATVQVVMTRAATHFVAPLTFSALSGRACLVDQFEAEETRAAFVPPDDPDHLPIVHIDLARQADAVLVAPASANLLGKVAHGIADDLLSVTLMATTAPVLFAPAMNTHMWENPVVQRNVTLLRELGHGIIDPDAGDLACGEGPGRLAEPATIVEALRARLAATPAGGALAGRTVLVSAGRTEEPIDPVRSLTNRSSGRMGYALAQAALELGAHVILVSGPADIEPPPGVELRRVRTAAEMEAAVLGSLDAADCLIMAAAVADFRPRQASTEKLRRAAAPAALELEPTPDILAAAGARKGRRLHVGFALETGDGLVSARRKLAEKNLDLIILNPADEAGAGIGSDTNRVTFVDTTGERPLPRMPKRDVARHVLAEVVRLLGGTGH
ncbi:MAG: bifunctional phosphopantothenoylcysteine decarboxylase/phosphopantothenate--cysteine ligase CoaBC [Candidatus Eiseniibacteriota bacterium]|jgi:phosphopantothenoylcysteine decarboxylase/phosphopantothenate--cysteine ligase